MTEDGVDCLPAIRAKGDEYCRGSSKGKLGLGKPLLLIGEAAVLPLACPTVDGDGKKANT